MKQNIKILAIDQASKCGWCCSLELNGVWDFTTRKDESMGMKLLRFKSKLREVCEAESIDVVVYERVAGFHKGAIIHAAKMVGIMESFCEESKIEYRAYSAAEIKKFATGKGNANKPKMIEAAKLKYPSVEIIDDNHADALHIYHLALQDLS
jgi:Holliday junction resolvasome RuvABC endonuclease subunit